MQWYYDRIKDKSSELEKYPGYLPSIVRMAINLSNWYDFLKEKGLYEKTMDEIYSKRHISIGEDFEDFRQWVKDNPEYSEFIDENSTPEIDDYSDMRPVGGLNVDYFLEHAEEIINDTEHLSNPYDFSALKFDDNEMVRYYYRELEKTHREMWMAFGRGNTFMNPDETDEEKALSGMQGGRDNECGCRITDRSNRRVYPDAVESGKSGRYIYKKSPEGER